MQVEILSSDQIAIMDQLLPVVPAKGDIVPGILGWGDAETVIDIQRKGDFFEYRVTSQGRTVMGNSREWDPRWRRFTAPGDNLPAERKSP
jgi:hypothetical protein